MKLVHTVAALDDALAGARQGAAAIGLVPTMGAFHAGHLSLMRAARAGSELVVVSLFVNPAQFGRNDDLARYPRDESADAEMARAEQVDVLFAPAVDEVYPPGFDTWVQPGGIGSILEGVARPDHFRGVATVCLKLFGLVRPEVAWFGRKDAQQLAVIRQMVRDFSLPIRIAACPTIRDVDGLALSSRNAYLSPEDRAIALALPRALQAGLAAHRAGTDAGEAARAVLQAQPGLRVDYAAVADLDGATLAAAIRVGSTRLIDNVLLSDEEYP